MNKIKTVNQEKSSWSDICVSPPLPLCLLDGLMHVMDGWKHESPCCWMSFSPSFLFLRRQHLVWLSRRMVERTALGWTVMMTDTHTRSKKHPAATTEQTHRHNCPMTVRWRWGGRGGEGKVLFFSICKVGLKSRRRAERKQEVSCEVWGHWYKMCCEGLLRNQRVRGQFDRELGASGERKEGSQSSHHHVAAAVQGEVVRPGEGAVAFGAAEGFDSGVLAKVSGQLVGAGEAPGAAFPGTVVGLLSWKRRGEELAGRRQGRRLKTEEEGQDDGGRNWANNLFTTGYLLQLLYLIMSITVWL